ncbi:MAG TPA: prepilin-type N-terminal cleavage/methylation domain-containing protein [Tepidisphaeraceae bacterium]|jgi:prepilin-type processing-associated H-X9-DG protein/prepilin-type N-terminal cleavage/methylation domain-containing protein
MFEPKKAGFTLVELLVVIGIIALLISILLPSLNRAKQSAMAIQCASNLRQYGIADQMYVNDSRGWHVPCFWGPYQYNRTWTGLPIVRKTLGWPLINPQDTTTYTVPGKNTVTGNNGWCYVPKTWFCPLALRGATEYLYPPLNTWVVPMLYSYGENVQGVDDKTLTTPDGVDAYDPADFPQCSTNYDTGLATTDYRNAFPCPIGSYHGFKTSQVKHPSEKLFMADALGIGVNENGSGLSVPPAPSTLANENYGTTGESITTGAERTTAWRHLGKANVLFFDGHVAGLRHDELTTRDSSGNYIGNDQLWKVNL